MFFTFRGSFMNIQYTISRLPLEMRQTHMPHCVIAIPYRPRFYWRYSFSYICIRKCVILLSFGQNKNSPAVYWVRSCAIYLLENKSFLWIRLVTIQSLWWILLTVSSSCVLHLYVCAYLCQRFDIIWWEHL